MCVIAVCENRGLTETEVRAMARANPHGVGVAWASPKHQTVAYVKGLNTDEAVTLLAAVRPPYVAHFRIASVGMVRPELCHPFPITPEAELLVGGYASAVLFHNGTWRNWELGHALVTGTTTRPSPQARTEWSDSRVMAAMMTQYKPQAVAEIVGAEQRLAVLTGKGRVRLFGHFADHDGIRVSNLYWAPRVPMEPVELYDDDELEALFTEAWLQTPPQPLSCTQPLSQTRRSKPRVPRPTWPARWSR